MHEQAPDQLRPVVIAPTFNNERTVIDVLRGVTALALPIIVVDDGCTDRSPALLSEWSANRDDVTVLTHAANRGKADALRSGFDCARHRGHTHAVTIDTDGQLDPRDIPMLIEQSRRSPESLVLGNRTADAENRPGRCAVGRRFSSLFLWLETGVRLTDSQCGLRVYPLSLFDVAKARTRRFAFETEIITRASWAGFGVEQVPVRARYFPPQDRVSHYRPWIDTLRIALLHVRLIARALAPWPHRSRAGAYESTDSRWRRMWRWIDPRRAWREVRGTDEQRDGVALGLAFGAFIANTPLYGLHSVISLYVARRLSLHPVPVLIGSQFATPPVGPVLIAVAIVVGHVLLHGSIPALPEFDGGFMSFVVLPLRLIVEWTVGSLIVGTVCMVVTFFGTLLLLRRVPTVETGASSRPSENPSHESVNT